MGNKIILFILFSLFLFSVNSKNSYINNYQQEENKKELIHTIDTIIENSEKSVIVIDSLNKSIKHKKELITEIRKDKLECKKEINSLIKSLVKKIEQNKSPLQVDSIFYDTICIKERWFIGTKIMGKTKCKEGYIRKYIVKDKNNIKVDSTYFKE